MNNLINSVDKTVRFELCVSCGICKEVCPKDAIKLEFARGQYVPLVDEQKCNGCMICLKVCPGIEVGYEALYKHEGRTIPNNIFEGKTLESYTAYANEETIRVNGASGGVITALITSLLSNKIYKGAFVLPPLNMDDGPAKMVYTENPIDVAMASKSKYAPVSVGEIIKQSKMLESAIIVGTPCHIHGIKKYMKLFKIDSSKFLFLGLFCDKTLNYNLLKFYQWKYGKGRKIKDFYYKHKGNGGWPGHTKIVFDNKNELFIDRKVRMGLKRYFQLNRCFYCVDKLNQLADISFGDCYIKGEETEQGQSSVIVRTEKGKQALYFARAALYLKSVNISDIILSQKLYDRKENLFNCIVFEQRYDHKINRISNLDDKTFKNIEKAEKKLEQLQAVIELGRNNRFMEINRQLKKALLKNNIRRLVGYVVRRIGFRR